MPEMGAGLRPVIETENALHNSVQVRRDEDGPGAPAERAAGMLVVGQVYAISRAHGGDGSGKNHGAPGGAHFHDRQVMVVSECLDFVQIVGIGAVSGGEFFAAQVFALMRGAGAQFFRRRQSIQRLTGPHQDADLDKLVRVRRSDHAGTRPGRALAAWKDDAILMFCHRSAPLFA